VQFFHDGVLDDYTIAGFHSSSLRPTQAFTDSAGAVWFGTANDGLYRVWKGTVDHFSRSDGLSGQDVNRIFEDHEGNLWVSTDGGIDLFRNTPVTTYSINQGLSTDNILTVLTLRDGTIWTGNYASDSANGGIEEPASILQSALNGRFSSGPEVPGRIEALFQDHSGAVWLGLGDDADSHAMDELSDSLAAYGEELAQLWPPSFHLTVTGKQFQLNPIVRDEIHRVGREALGNAFKHSNGSAVKIEIAYLAAEFRMRISDDGDGMDPEIANQGRPGHWGLDNMRQRARKIGAVLNVSSTPNNGATVELTIPLKLARERHGFWSHWRSKNSM
jgi:two-component sensor histidine kinase